MAIKKFVKRVAKKAKRVLKKRYGTWANPKYSQILSDVKMLKGVINAEKKRYLITSATPVPVGQVNANATGNIAQDITPIPSEGITYNTRTGASIKIHSAFYRFQFYQQSSRVSPMKIKLYWVLVKGAPQLTSTAQSQFFQSNPFVSGTIYDYNSNRNPDYFGQYTVIRTKTVYLKDENINGDTTIKDIQVGIKFNKGRGHHIRFDKDTTTVVDGQLMLFIVADTGNSSSSTGSTISNIPITSTNTGALFNFNHTYYYYDN